LPPLLEVSKIRIVRQPSFYSNIGLVVVASRIPSFSSC
jgi:hypothetical protein